ncbi:hypothetical protein DQ04_12741020 [Trypanosoma grayi]|uniref:hypothetical protein n=1 Tax=Trypanosoma grayi TaxID=71804 RepID=UPI0004F4270F|nr:hypothetical protein DQ04_12741020 [Trypanosoma grayi]KEG06689.1 hypothetical protein DQ04_12741020 [Trypanosoma grayi]
MYFNCDESYHKCVHDSKETVPSVEVENDRGERCRVMNLSAFAGPTTSGRRAVNHQFALYAFREYVPINVRTRCRFSHSVEDALRAHSMLFGCWWTVWGAPDDFKAVGADVLQGPLGVWVFDEWGSPLFLVSALACEDAVAAVAHAHPGDIVRRTKTSL